jgi:hypothetical protein
MSNSPAPFVVVSDDGTATVFKATVDGADNEEAANEFRDELAAAKPWQDHKVQSLTEYQKDSEKAVKAADKNETEH